MLAYNNTFTLVAVLASATALYLLAILLVRWRRNVPLSSLTPVIQEMRR